MRTNSNIELILKMAEALGDICKDVVFVGGSVTSLLVDSPEASDPRVTNDIDVIVGIVNAPEFSVAEQRLIEKRFQPVPEVRCRYTKSGMVLDFMPISDHILGFGNRWYADAYRHAVTFSIGNMQLRHISAPYFLATKLEAFLDRGKGDLYASHDLEEMFFVVCGRPSIVEDVLAANQELRDFVSAKIGNILQSADIRVILEGHLALESEGKAELTFGRLQRIATGQ